jgi:hypothetical protein
MTPDMNPREAERLAMESSLAEAPMPPGWEQALCPRTGVSYFIDHLSKTTTFADPRLPECVNQLSILQRVFRDLRKARNLALYPLQSRSRSSSPPQSHSALLVTRLLIESNPLLSRQTAVGTEERRAKPLATKSRFTPRHST